MTLAPGVHRVQIVAGLSDGESMTHTLWIAKRAIPIESDTGINVVRLAQTVRDAWQTHLTTAVNNVFPTSLLSTATVYQRVVAYEMDHTTGRAREVGEASFGTTAKGTGGTAMPTEVAAAVTLLTGEAGRMRRGRLFLGGFSSATLTATGRLTPAACLTFATMTRNVLAAIRAVSDEATVDAPYVPVVHSLTSGTQRPVTAVSVGDVYDVQRRRRNKITEARTAVTL